MTPCIYRGTVSHERFQPRTHRFNYRVSSWFIDLDDLPRLNRWHRLTGYNRFALWSIHDADHGLLDDESTGQTGNSTRQQINQLVQQQCGERPARVRMLCFPRFLGYAFNPLAIFYCYDDQGCLMAMVHQVTNTFHQRHCYVIPVNRLAADQNIEQRAEKVFYVSPFMQRSGHYLFYLQPPASKLQVQIDYCDDKQVLLSARLSGQRKPFALTSLFAEALRTPFLSAKVVAAIHWQALRLWLKKIPLTSRPIQPTNSLSRGITLPSPKERV